MIKCKAAKALLLGDFIKSRRRLGHLSAAKLCPAAIKPVQQRARRAALVQLGYRRVVLALLGKARQNRKISQTAFHFRCVQPFGDGQCPVKFTHADLRKNGVFHKLSVRWIADQ